jgi:hypothetical protein
MLSTDESITPWTCIQYLAGSRKAILKLASSPQTIRLGLLLVISAGFAREYDGEDLLKEPWHLVLPLVASLCTSLLLFGLIDLLATRRGAPADTFLGSYWRFLGLYWMTAPLAWFYAIPVERFLSAPDAVHANIAFLELVSVWRVCLITRVIVVWYEASPLAVLPLVMLFADSVALVLIAVIPKPIMSVMSGMRLTESELVIRGATVSIGILGLMSWPIWFLWSAIVFAYSKPNWKEAIRSPARRVRNHAATWVLAVLSVLGWALVLPYTQAEQRRRAQAEELLLTGRLDEALTLMSTHLRDDFPPHWDPPPRPGYAERNPRLVDVVERLADREDDWVRQIFMAKISKELSGHHFYDSGLSQMKDEERRRILTVFERLLDDERYWDCEVRTGSEPGEKFRYTLQSLIADDPSNADGVVEWRVSNETREIARSLLERIGKRLPKNE